MLPPWSGTEEMLFVQSGYFAAAAAGPPDGHRRPLRHGREWGGPKAAPLADAVAGASYFFFVDLHFWADSELLVEPSANRVVAVLDHFLWHRAIT